MTDTSQYTFSTNLLTEQEQLENDCAERRQKAQKLLQESMPHVSGVLCFSRIAIYYLTGAFTPGVLWLPSEGDPILYIRKGVQKAQRESSLNHVVAYQSFKDLEPIAKERGIPLGDTIATEMQGLTWNLGQNLASKLAHKKLVPGDVFLQKLRACKTDFELDRMRQAGSAHNQVFSYDLPRFISAGMSEFLIAITILNAFFARGHHGQIRMSSADEIYLGSVAAGDSANQPSYFNGPVAMGGIHTTAQYMGSPYITWEKNMLLTVDTGFVYQGYHSDKTRIYFSGSAKKIPGKAQKAHDCCLAIQQAVIGMLRPGVTPKEIYEKALAIANAEGYADTFMAAASNGNQVPFLGHSIGLTVDETPVITSAFTEPLELNMTFAIEPKIALPELGMVGTENVFVVTSDGGKSLTGTDDAIICIE